MPSEATIKEVLSLKQQISELEKELERTRTAAPEGTEDLMQGDDPFEMKVTFYAKPPGGSYYDRRGYSATISPSWNDIFAGVAPVLINEETEPKLRQAFRNFLSKISHDEFKEHEDLKDYKLSDFFFSEDDIYTCMVQLRALGLIKESDKKPSVRDTDTYWTLTPYGDQTMVKLRAISRKPKTTRRIGSEATESANEEA